MGGGVPETFSLHLGSSIICIVTMHVGEGPVFLLIVTSATSQPPPPSPLPTRVKRQLGKGVDDWLAGTWLESGQAVNLVCPTQGRHFMMLDSRLCLAWSQHASHPPTALPAPPHPGFCCAERSLPPWAQPLP